MSYLPSNTLQDFPAKLSQCTEMHCPLYSVCGSCAQAFYAHLVALNGYWSICIRGYFMVVLKIESSAGM